MAQALPRRSREFTEALCSERWIMLTLDTEVSGAERLGYAKPSAWWEGLRETLEYAAARMAGDGFEGEPDTREIADQLLEHIGNEIVAFGVAHRLAETTEAVAA